MQSFSDSIRQYLKSTPVEGFSVVEESFEEGRFPNGSFVAVTFTLKPGGTSRFTYTFSSELSVESNISMFRQFLRESGEEAKQAAGVSLRASGD